MPVRALAGRSNRSGRRPLVPVNKLRTHSTPPPIAGWNARDSISNMSEDEAVELVNWFPEETRVSVRKGYDSHATGLTGDVESLMSWEGPSSRKLFAADSTDIYEVTSAGAVGAAAVSSLTNGRWQHVMFSNSAGNYLYMVNGADAPRHYDGSSWVSPSLTTISDASTLIHMNVFKNRLFFVDKDTLSFWYLAVDTVAGALTEFDLGPNASKGGHLVAMGTWTRDGGDGVDDLAVFITSEGQVIIYQGSDPGDATAWSLVGVFNIGAPIGRRCMIKIGAELIVVTEDGFSTLSRFLAGARSSSEAAMSDKISGAVETAVADHRSRFGWEPVFYPAAHMILFNIPGPVESVQFVSHATTGAWCKFTDWDANCFGIHGNELYFGGNTVVNKAWQGEDDNTANIVTKAKTAFSYFGNRGLLKRFAMVRPMFLIDGAVTAALRINVDFEDEATNTTPTFTAPTGAVWDDEAWDAASWGDAGTINKNWQTIDGIGNSASMLIETTSNSGELHWNSTDWLLEPAANPGFLG